MNEIVSKLKRFANVIRGRDFFVKCDYECKKETLGSEHYGGWTIASDEINESSIVYSFGVGTDVSFDLALIGKFGATVHAFDPTPKSIAWVRSQSLPAKFVLHEYGISNLDGEVSFHAPANPNYVSHSILARPELSKKSISVPVKRLTSIMTELGHTHIDIMKMDIEGAEYVTLEDVLASDIRPRQVLIEFHHRFENIPISKTKQALENMRQAGYGLFSVSKNGEELSFIQRPPAAT